MIIYRHPTEVEHPDLKGWTHRSGSDAALCHQSDTQFHYCGVSDPLLWQIPSDAEWKDLDGVWQAARVVSAVIPARDLTNLRCWANVLPVQAADGAQWIAPAVLTKSGSRAFPISYSGSDFLPALTPEQQRVESIAREARSALAAAADGVGIPVAAACRWAAVLLGTSNHCGASTIAMLGLLDDVLVKAVLLAASGLDERMAGDG